MRSTLSTIPVYYLPFYFFYSPRPRIYTFIKLNDTRHTSRNTLFLFFYILFFFFFRVRLCYTLISRCLSLFSRKDRSAALSCCRVIGIHTIVFAFFAFFFSLFFLLDCISSLEVSRGSATIYRELAMPINRVNTPRALKSYSNVIYLCYRHSIRNQCILINIGIFNGFVWVCWPHLSYFNFLNQNFSN